MNPFQILSIFGHVNFLPKLKLVLIGAEASWQKPEFFFHTELYRFFSAGAGRETSGVFIALL